MVWLLPAARAVDSCRQGRRSSAAYLPLACMGTLSLAILANLLQAVAHRAMAAARSAGPAPWMTPRSFRASVQPNNGPAAARMAAVSRALDPSTPDLGRFTDKLMVCISSAFRPASPASSTAAASPCTKAVQSSTQVLTAGRDCKSRSNRHGWVMMAK